MGFNVSADAYMRFMGRYSEPLAARFAELAGIHRGQRVLDVGCGPGPLTAFWSAVRELDPSADDESGLAGVREGHLAELFAQAGLGAAQVTALTVRVRYDRFEQWWEPLTLGVGPAGSYVASLAADRRAALREQCRRQLPADPVEISATAWAAVSRI